MARTNFFFKRQEFTSPEIHKPYYTYLGYLIEGRKDPYPISIYFGKDEIAVYYTKDDSQVLKIFSLYVAEGTINQQMLAKKVEDYALMPLWPISDDLLKNERKRLHVDPVLLRTGFFASYYGFEFREKRFSKINLPGSRSNIVHIKDDSALGFIYEKRGEDDKNAGGDTWKIDEDGEDGKVKASRISFSKILLDFLFELDFANTFEDENFFKLQPYLQNNLVLDALTKKCRYLYQLNKLRDFSQTTIHPALPKPFLNAEKEWLNVCRLERYKPVFVSPNSLFYDPETEVKKIFFEPRVGRGGKPRTAFLKNKEDAQLKNEICTFFMRKYNIWRAFRTLMPAWVVLIFPFIVLSIPLGDYFLNKCQLKDLAGISTIYLPLLLLISILIYNAAKGINLFKLLLPRLFLGIMLGWSIFWGTEEFWKKALMDDAERILISSGCLLIILFLYIFTDISNRMYRTTNFVPIALKTVNLIIMALLISFVMGFYVIQFYAEPMLNHSGFLSNKRLYTDQFAKYDPNFDPDLKDVFTTDEERLKEDVKYFIKSEKIKNYRSIDIHFPWKTAKAIYVWSILFSQLVVSILIGVVLQLLWEDRPITEPL
jgi:hypothetical protein